MAVEDNKIFSVLININSILKKYNNNAAFIKLFPNKNSDKNNSNN